MTTPDTPTLVERLRDADRNSQQRVLGSRIFCEAANRIEYLEARAEKLAGALAKICPIRVHDGPDYAEVYFADGKTHSTQAMTMNPQDWRDLHDALSENAGRVG